MPVIRLFGVTAEGNSITAHVYGFKTHMYAHIPSEITLGKQDLEELQSRLNGMLGIDSAKSGVVHLEVTEKFPMTNYQPHKSKFVKIYVSHPKLIV